MHIDAHQIAESNKVDVLLPERQKEIRELVDHIKKFAPTKIALEALPEWEASKKLKQFVEGDLELGRDERHQLGFRIAKELELDTIYSIDARNLAQDLDETNPEYMDSLFEGFDFTSEDTMEYIYKKWIEYDDQIKKQTRLIDYFKYMNSEENHQYGYGLYLIGDFKLGKIRGADILSIWWYNRNLRIFRKIQEIPHDEEERILIIIGNGHAAVLRQLLQASPEYELQEFNDL